MPENIIQIDQHMLETRLDRLVTQKVTEILNAMLDAEADEIAGASRYERSGGWKAYRADHYERRITAKAGTLELKVPKLKGALFESAVVERYRGAGKASRRPDRHVPGGRLHPPGRRHQPAAVGREDALADPLRQTQEGVRRHRLVAHEAVGTRIPLRVHGRRVAQALVGRLGGERERARRRRGELRSHRKVIGVAEGMKEDSASWEQFVRGMIERGLRGVRLVVGDRCAGLVSTVRSMLRGRGTSGVMGGGAVLLDFFILAF